MESSPAVRVLFISKPIVAPFHDGAKCLVRDIALSVTRVDPVLLSSREAPPIGESRRPPELVPLYAGAGSFAPALADNLRAAAWVLLRSRADVWHFVFAPNPRTSRAGAWLRRIRRVPVVQTIASPPRVFEDLDTLLFGDVVVAQSQWTRQRVLDAFERCGQRPPVIRVIPPPVPTELTRSPDRALAIRAQLGIPAEAPMFVYPGDLEVSQGARVTAELSRRLAARVPGAITVFAYRRKTPRADAIAAQLAAELDPACTRLIGEVPDVLDLIAGATAVVFPVDDLWGKVDLPIVLLEAMVLGVPVVALGQGPLLDLSFASLVPSLDIEAWVSTVAALAEDPAARQALCARQRRGVLERHARSVVASAYEDLYLALGEGLPLPTHAPEHVASVSEVMQPAPLD